MRKDNLLNIRSLREFGNQKPGERFEVYLNLAARIKVTGPNHLWIAEGVYSTPKDGIRALTKVRPRILCLINART